MSNPTTPRVPPSSPLVLGSPRGGRTVHCTHTHPQPLAPAAWERADAREEGRRSAVLGEEGDPTKSPFLGSVPSWPREKPEEACLASFTRVLGIGIALWRSCNSFARKIYALGGADCLAEQSWRQLRTAGVGHAHATHGDPRLRQWAHTHSVRRDAERPTTASSSTLLAASTSVLSPWLRVPHPLRFRNPEGTEGSWWAQRNVNAIKS